jgi:hypothetical protein
MNKSQEMPWNHPSSLADVDAPGMAVTVCVTAVITTAPVITMHSVGALDMVESVFWLHVREKSSLKRLTVMHVIHQGVVVSTNDCGRCVNVHAHHATNLRKHTTLTQTVFICTLHMKKKITPLLLLAACLHSHKRTNDHDSCQELSPLLKDI